MILRKLILCVFPVFLTFYGCDPFNSEFGSVEKARYYVSDEITDTEYHQVLRVMTWNVKFGGGRLDFFFDCHGDRVLMTSTEVKSNLDGIVSAVNRIDPDVLLLQEIDVLSKRSAYIDQVKYILQRTALNYGVYASQWKSDFVPSDGIGRVDSGNAILSKYQLSHGERIALPFISSQDSITQYFYLKRNILRVLVTLPDRIINVFNIHTSAYSDDGTKKDQLDIFLSHLLEIDTQGEIFIAGGDFNTIPPGSDNLSDFPDSVCTNEDFIADDYSGETDWLDGFYNQFIPAVSLSDYQEDNSSYFTHTTDKDGFWNRKLDYLWTNSPGGFKDTVTHQNEISGADIKTMDLSDHAPISTVMELNP
ncbi:MAG: endonuclease/exonuclease/phosphatase family protein [Deltaproteobacteria bacterium]|nr:endonuclease/exonuclease/phosphatase family protein [Deltaproteobacteria bacterium]